MHFTVEQYTDHVDYTKSDLVRTGVNATFNSFCRLAQKIKEYPKRQKEKRSSSQAIRDRHLEVIRNNEQPVIEPTQIIV